jgi:hypothetical protein
MAKAVCRNGDIGSGTCTSHIRPISMTGILLASCATVVVNGLPIGLVGDVVMGNCGHIGVMISGATNITGANRDVVRVGDAFSGAFSGVLITGSATVDSN